MGNMAFLIIYTAKTTKTYSVSYNACEGSGAPSAQTKTYGKTLTLNSTKPTKTGYKFVGWSTSGCGAASATYSAGGYYTYNSGSTMYAVWIWVGVSKSCSDVCNDMQNLTKSIEDGNSCYYCTKDVTDPYKLTGNQACVLISR